MHGEVRSMCEDVLVRSEMALWMVCACGDLRCGIVRSGLVRCVLA